MGAINFLFGIHNHQPVGNFGWVFQDAFESCYLPLVEHLEKFPKVRAALHFSGPLLEWIEAEHPEYFALVRSLVQRGQVEILGGGMYEPILSTLPINDAIGQIRELTRYVKKHFDAEVRGIWLTERIWEPSLPSILVQAGIEYTIIDESHFRYAGLKKDQMSGYWITEDRGNTLAVFPIDMELRYRIPFNLPEKVIEYLGEAAERGDDRAAVYGDDGEKFGVWPGTHKWVFEEKWLEKFFTALTENRDWIRMPHFSEFLDSHKPMGRVYLPTASYEEMMMWALPAESTQELEDLVAELKQSGQYERFHSFLRGGFWPNFFSKYPESNRMHKKMLDVSRKVQAAYGEDDQGEKLPEARRELYRSQCNCAYWHGLFGGLYLNYLRHAVYSCMLNAEGLAEREMAEMKNPFPVLQELDLDCDGNDELVISGKRIGLMLKPDSGGRLDLLADKKANFMLSNTLTRRKEAYHRKIQNQARSGDDTGDEQPKTIHEITQSKQEGLEDLLIADWYDRACFIDHFLYHNVDLAAFSRSQYGEVGDFVGSAFRVEKLETKKRQVTARLVREGVIKQDNCEYEVKVEKTYRVISDIGEIEVDYKITNQSEKGLDLRFGSEQNLTLLAGDADDRYYLVNGKKPEQPKLISVAEVKKVKSISLVDEYFDIEVQIGSGQPFTFWRFPIETVSQSEGGFEKTYQGSCLLLLWEFALAVGQTKNISLRLTVKTWR